MGNKSQAKNTMEEFDIPVIPGNKNIIKDIDEIEMFAKEYGYPIMLKASAGGGGKGMRVVKKSDEIVNSFNAAQAEANMQTQQASAELEIQKQQALKQAEAQLEQMKAQMDSQKLMQEAEVKKELMEQEFQYNMQLRQLDMRTIMEREGQKEDRKDKRTKIQATQQSEMIDQRKKDKPPKNFESSGNDIIGGGFDLGAFEPR